MAPGRRYSKAPIVEAVIDLRFDAPFTEREMERLRDRFKTQFPSVDEKRTFNIELGLEVGVKQQSSLAGFKMTAKNAADLILINESSFGTARLAPYERWEAFGTTAKENFQIFTKVVGRKTITRVGVRFINRIDIPHSLAAEQPLNNFLRVGVAMPVEMSQVIGGFNIAAEGIEPSTNTPFILNAGTILPSPLIEHVSIQLDIDAYWDADIPGRVDELWAGTERLRQAKNAIFECSLTDDLRGLFE